MAHINTCLKRIFTVFNILFAILGILLIILAGLIQMYTRNETDMENRTQGLIAFYTVGILTTVIAIMGAYGAHKESKGALVSFLVCMVIGCLLMFRTGFNVALTRPEAQNAVEMALRQFVPLDNQPTKLRDMVEMLQYTEKCCGLTGDDDWRTIPASCECEAEEEAFGTCKTVHRYRQSFYLSQRSQEEHSVYAKPCLPIIQYYYQLITDIEIAVAFTLASLALLGMGLSSFMIHQINRRNRRTVLLTTSTIFTTQSPKYQELQNPLKFQDHQIPPKYEEVQNPPPQYTEH